MANTKTSKIGLTLEPQNANPSSPQEGQLQIASSSHSTLSQGLYRYDGNEWKAAGGGVGSLTLIKSYKSNDDGTGDFTVKSKGLESTTSQGILPDFDATDTLTATFVGTDTGEALFTNDNADKVYSLQSAANSRYDAQGVTISIPAYARGKDVGLSMFYRTADTSGASVDADYMVWVFDQTNGVITTTTSTGAQAAGSSLVVGTSTGMSVGDKIWIGETGGTNGVTESHITAIADGTHVTLADAVNLTSGDRVIVGILTDVLTTMDAADSDSNNIGEEFKVTFLPAETTASVTVLVQQLTAEDDSFIFFDALALDSDPFKKVSTQAASELFEMSETGNFWDAATDTDEWDHTLLVPAVTGSKYITISDISSQTRITAKQNVKIHCSVTGLEDNNGFVAIYDSSDVIIQHTNNKSGSDAAVGASATINLVKGDYFYLRGNNPVAARTGSLSLHIFPEVNQSVIVESTDSVLSEWTSFTPSVIACGTITNAVGKYRRVGDSMEIEATFLGGSSVSSDAELEIPGGFLLDLGKISGSALNYLGTFVRVEGTSLYFSTASRSGVLFSDASDNTSLYFSMLPSANGVMLKSNGDTITGTGQGIVLKATIPIAGWSANPTPLLAFPTITYGQEPEDYIASDAVVYASANTALPSFLTVTKNTISNLGTITNDTTSGFIFTATQRCEVDMTFRMAFTAGGHLGISKNCTDTELDTTFQGIPASKAVAMAYTETANASEGCTFSGILEPGDFIAAHCATALTGSTSAIAQGVTLKVAPIQGVTNQASIIDKPRVLIKDHKSSGTAGGTFTSGADRTRDLNTLSGDIAAVGVTLSSNQFTLPAGKYSIVGLAPALRAAVHKTKLYNITDSKDVAIGSNSSSDNAAFYAHSLSRVEAVITITKTTTFELRHRCSTTFATNGFGQAASYGDDEVYATVSIERHK